MDKIVFFILRFFRKFIESSGADFDQVRLIVRYKTLMDNRKGLNPNNTRQEPQYSMWLQYLMYLIFGGFASMIIGVAQFPYTGMFMAYAYLMVMLSVNLISDFSTVLFDTRDNTIIIPRPVSERTYLLSRIVHIASYLLGFTISFCIIPVIVMVFRFNPLASVIFFINALLSAVFSVFFTHLLYMGLMKIVSGERFKDIIAYFQIGITIFMMGGYQLLMRLLDKLAKVELVSDKWWSHLLPPSWMAGSNDIFVSFHLSSFSVISLVLSVVIPFAGLWFVVKVLAPGYTNKLAIMEQGDLTKVTEHNNKTTLSGLLAKIFARTRTESAIFQTIWKIAGRDRKFKQTVYPMLGSIFVFVFIIRFGKHSMVSDFSKSYQFLILLYLPLFYLFIIVANLKYSDNFKSAWIYKVIPIKQPGEVVSATIKAIVVKLFFPVYLAVNAFMFYFRGFGFIYHVYVGFMLCIIALVGILSLSKVDLPFTTDSAEKNNNGNMLLAFLIFPLAAVLAGFHYLFMRFNFNMLVTSIVLTLICWFAFRMFRKMGWRKIEAFEV